MFVVGQDALGGEDERKEGVRVKGDGGGGYLEIRGLVKAFSGHGGFLTLYAVRVCYLL